MSKAEESTSGGARQTRVAVDVLQRDQRALLFDGDPKRQPPLDPLQDGFDTRRQAINWWQAAAVRTFGHISEVFAATQLARDGALETALWGTDPDAGADHLRQRLVEITLRACDIAYRDLETQADEWLADADTGTDWTRIDPEEQAHIAMRPAFDRLDTQQARCLIELWGGFDDRQALARWTHALPAVADFSDVLGDGETVMAVFARDDLALRMLLTESEEARRWRERFAAVKLLPAFAKRARRLQAGERLNRRGDPNPWNEV